MGLRWGTEGEQVLGLRGGGRFRGEVWHGFNYTHLITHTRG